MTKGKKILAWCMVFVLLCAGGQNLLYGEREDLRVSASSQKKAEAVPEAGSVVIGDKVSDREIETSIGVLSNTATVGTKKAFMKKLHGYLNQRERSFIIVFKGPYQKIYKNKDIQAMFEQAWWGIDNPSTSNDFDYLYGNIAKYAFRIPVYSSRRSVFVFNITYRESAAQTIQVNARIKKILAGLQLEGKNRVEQVKLIHDYIAQNVTYDNSLTRYTAYDGLVSSYRSTVCQGYALIFYKMCTEVGIPCRMITGYGWSGSSSIPHAWNIVKINGKWYHVDTTWDDTDRVKKPVVYDYFLRGSASMNRDHTMDSEYRRASFKKKYKIASGNYQWKTKIGTGQNSTATPVPTTEPVATNIPKATASTTPKATASATPKPVVREIPKPTATEKPVVTAYVTATPQGNVVTPIPSGVVTSVPTAVVTATGLTAPTDSNRATPIPGEKTDWSDWEDWLFDWIWQ